MTTTTITLKITSSMDPNEVEQWIADAIETDLTRHLLEGETITVAEVK